MAGRNPFFVANKFLTQYLRKFQKQPVGANVNNSTIESLNNCRPFCHHTYMRGNKSTSEKIIDTDNEFSNFKSEVLKQLGIITQRIDDIDRKLSCEIDIAEKFITPPVVNSVIDMLKNHTNFNTEVSGPPLEQVIWIDVNPKVQQLLSPDEWKSVVSILRRGGTIVDTFTVDDQDFSMTTATPGDKWPHTSYMWYPPGIVEELLQTAFETHDPGSLVDQISLEIPPNSGIDFPTALLSQHSSHIRELGQEFEQQSGAKLRCFEYEIANKPTGQRFHIELRVKESGEGSGALRWFMIKREDD